MKGDRVERVVVEAMCGWQWNARKRKSPVNLPAVAIKLLRREQVWVRRMVKKVGQVTTSEFGTSNECLAWRMACADILARLDARKQGGR